MSSKELRQHIRTKRLQLSLIDRKQYAEQLSTLFLNTAIFKNSHSIAAYFAYEGEMDPHELLTSAFQVGKEIYLPRLLPGKLLQFCHYRPGDRCETNQYGILEPVTTDNCISAKDLDLVLVPLVAFDKNGNRLGMGAGYYDRTFAFLSVEEKKHKPFLMGLAYEFQCVPSLEKKIWDIPLNAVVTEKTIYHFN